MSQEIIHNDQHLLAITYVEAMISDDKQIMDLIVEEVGETELLQAVSQLSLILAASAGTSMSALGKPLDVETVFKLLREVFIEDKLEAN